MTKLYLAALLSALALIGCRTQLIPNTDVEDTEQNRSIIEFCETYRKAVERRQIGLLLELAHPDYYEDGGNIDSEDDLDFAGLKKYLQDRFNRTKAIRYEIRYRRVGQGRDNHLYVDYTYSASYKIPTGKGDDIWQRTVADNRLELVPHKDTFKIIAGM